MSHNEAEEVGVEESKVNFDPTWSFVPPQNEALAPQEPAAPSDDATDAAQEHEADTESGSDADGVEEHVTDMETEIETVAPDTEEGEDLDVKIRKLPEPPVELSYGVKHSGRPKLVCERPGCENCVPKLDGGAGCPECEVRKREEMKKRREEYRGKQAEMQQEQQQRVVAGEAGKRNVRKHREALGTELQKRPVSLHAQVKSESEARESEVNEVLILRNRDFDEGDMMLMSAHLPADLDPIMHARLRSVLTCPSGYSTEEYRRVLRDFACRYLSAD